jgi:flavin reductase (DIM6/NTAB) family NADH-FMN oxidoreductase RutF
MNASKTFSEQTDLSKSFRIAMRELAGGVCAVSIGEGNDRGGLVATSVTSLSVNPPTLLVCVNRSASAWPLFQRYGSFGVNVLGSNHLDLAQHFSGMTGAIGTRRYEVGDWTQATTGVPVLNDALVVIQCEVEEVLERYSHGIVIGRVKSISTVQVGESLVYIRGGYSTLARSQS